MVDQLPLQIPNLGIDGWTNELLDSFPQPWSSDLARVPGGGVYGALHSMAANLQMINDYLIYGFNGTRIQTATDEMLDLAAVDFYGDQMPRKTGESDDSYRARIMAGLFIPYTTKEAFIQAITALTGVAPRLIEGWQPQQTGAYDWSYYDADIPARPSLYGDPNLPYQAFVIATLPAPTGDETATAIWGYDAGAGYDLYTGTYWNLTASNFISQFDLDQLIMRIKAFGITIWRKYIQAGALPFPIAQSYDIATGQSVLPISIQAFNGQYVVIASCNWNSSLSVTDITNDGFTINSSNTSSSSAHLNYVIIPVTQPLVVEGVGFISMEGGETTAQIPAPVPPATPGDRVALTPSWNTNYWIDTLATGEVNIAMSEAAPIGGTISYYFAPPTRSALQYLEAADIANSSIFISIPGIPPSCPFVTPNWNCKPSVEVVDGGIAATFDTTPPAGAFVQWSYFPLAGSGS